MEYLNGPLDHSHLQNRTAGSTHAMNAPDSLMGSAGVIRKYDLLQKSYPGTAHGGFEAFNKNTMIIMKFRPIYLKLYIRLKMEDQ